MCAGQVETARERAKEKATVLASVANKGQNWMQQLIIMFIYNQYIRVSDPDPDPDPQDPHVFALPGSGSA